MCPSTSNPRHVESIFLLRKLFPRHFWLRLTLTCSPKCKRMFEVRNQIGCRLVKMSPIFFWFSRMKDRVGFQTFYSLLDSFLLMVRNVTRLYISYFRFEIILFKKKSKTENNNKKVSFRHILPLRIDQSIRANELLFTQALISYWLFSCFETGLFFWSNNIHQKYFNLFLLWLSFKVYKGRYFCLKVFDGE